MTVAGVGVGTAGTGTAAIGSGSLDYQDSKTIDRYLDNPSSGRYGPSVFEQLWMASVVGHSGPQSIAGVEDEVRYTIAINTFASTSWHNRAGDFQELSERILEVKHDVDYPGEAVRASFPDDPDWVGGHQVEKGEKDGDGLMDRLQDDNTLLGAVFDFGWGLTIRYTPFLGDFLNYSDFVTDILTLGEDESTHTDTLNFEKNGEMAFTQTFRKFEVQLNRSDTAEITVDNHLTLNRVEDARHELSHTIVLDPPEKGRFSDIDGHPFAPEIRTLADEGIISGYGDGTFRPERSLTRAEFASMIVEAFDPSPSGRPNFSDVGGHWAESKIRTTAGAGFFGGYPDGTFRPDQNISKTEVIVALSSGLDYSGGDPSVLSNHYDDADEIPNWARQAVANAHATWSGIENYPMDRILDPTDEATRAEAAKYVYDASRDIETSTDPSTETVTGSLHDGESDAYQYATQYDDPGAVRVTLSGPETGDLDLYLTLDGRTPTTGDYDRASRSYGSEEELVLGEGGVDADTTLGILVDAYLGGGDYELTIEETPA